MSGEDSAAKITNLDELLETREITERISEFFSKRLKGHLSALAPLLAPGRVLGKYVGARESAPRADEAFAELTERYKNACAAFDLKLELDDASLAAIGASGPQVHPYEYSYEARGGKAAKRVTMTSPVRWAVSYGAEITLSQFRGLLTSSGETRSKALQRFIVNALAFQIVLRRNPGVGQLLTDLRYEFSVQTLAGLEELPLAVFGMHVPSFRPTEDLLATAVRLSGVPAFIELIHADTLAAIEDPLKKQIAALVDLPA